MWNDVPIILWNLKKFAEVAFEGLAAKSWVLCKTNVFSAREIALRRSQASFRSADDKSTRRRRHRNALLQLRGRYGGIGKFRLLIRVSEEIEKKKLRCPERSCVAPGETGRLIRPRLVSGVRGSPGFHDGLAHRWRHVAEERDA